MHTRWAINPKNRVHCCAANVATLQVCNSLSTAGLRGRGRRVTHKAQLAEEVSAAAPLAASLPAAGPAANPALPNPMPLPVGGGSQVSLAGASQTGQEQGKEALPLDLQKTPSAGKGQNEPGGRSTDQPPSADKASKGGSKGAGDKAAEGKAQLEDVAKLANELQPTGSTLSTMQVHTKVQLTICYLWLNAKQ